MEIEKQSEVIKFDDFMKVDIRVGLICNVEVLEKSKKMLSLYVDFGELGMRQVLAGIAKSYTPVELIGQRAAFVVNLEPRKMMGLESHGMILAAHDETDQPTIAFFDEIAVPGSRIG